MFGLDPTVLAIIALAAISAGAVSYGVLFSRIENDKKAQSRVDKVKSAETDRVKIKASRDRLAEMTKRRKSVQDSLKELEKKQAEVNKRKAATLKARIVQAGLGFTETQFYLGSAALGMFAGAFAFLSGLNIFMVVGIEESIEIAKKL